MYTLAIVHNPEDTNFVFRKNTYPKVQSHVNADETVSYFHVQWNDANDCGGVTPYPSVKENSCGDGEVYDNDFCLCDTVVTETAPYSALPTRDEVLKLTIGAYDPAIFADYIVVGSETTDPDGVTVYKKDLPMVADYTTETIFRVKDEFSNEYIFLKNIHSEVSVCGSFKFRNSPTFYDIAEPELVSGYQEVEAYIDHVHNHPNTPPFVCKSLLKHFGFSNPSPNHVSCCSSAFKSGQHTWINPDDDTDILTFGTLGERGNLAATTAAIVLCDDFLSPEADLDPASGAVKSPLLKLTQPLRSLELQRTFHHRRTNGLFYAGK